MKLNMESNKMIGIKKGMVILALSFMICPVLSHAGEVDLPKTGQTTCYDGGGVVIGCTDTGQDGDIQAGIEWPSPRFVDKGDGTVADHLTGLIWLKNANCGGNMTWENAITYCNNLASGSCGLSDGSVAGDWRLPNIVELESLVNSEEAIPAVWLSSQGFTGVQSDYYWSGSTRASATGRPWFVHMNEGTVDTLGKSNLHYVWPVRTGQGGPAQTWKTGQTTSYASGDDGDLQHGIVWPEPRFADNGDGTVTDHLTGLIWLKNANCGGNMTWEDSLPYCNSLANGACGLSDGSVAGDWRLPNRKELLSLVDHSRHDPALPQGHPFNNVQLDYYWSSTSFASYTLKAWDVIMGEGYVHSSHKSSYDFRYVWPVRAIKVKTMPWVPLLLLDD